MLEQPNISGVVIVPELQHGPEYALDWGFVDKDTIRVTFDLYSLPSSLIENNKYSDFNENKLNLLATMASMPSRSLKSIASLEYFLFIIRPYRSIKEIILKLEKLHVKDTLSEQYHHFSNTLKLTALNQKEKYTVCICYYQTNVSTKTPDLILCQDVINDYSKFATLRTDPKHGLLFITTQYSIIIALLVVLQSAFTIRKKRLAQIIGQHLSHTAHSIRTTLSSVSLVRQSLSSLDAATADQHHHPINGHGAMHHEPTIDEEESSCQTRTQSYPAIVISEPSSAMNNGANSSDETEPFLKHTANKNHVHFRLGPGEGSDEDDEERTHEENRTDSTSHPTTTSSNREPYDDNADAILSMAHILDTNKPWSRHSCEPSNV